MSEVAGPDEHPAGKYLERPQMGRGILLGGARRRPGTYSVLGGRRGRGESGKRRGSANIAILDVDMDRLRYLDDIMPPNVNLLFSDRHTIREELHHADLLIGAVLIPGARAPPSSSGKTH